jgi:hypothetical protein
VLEQVRHQVLYNCIGGDSRVGSLLLQEFAHQAVHDIDVVCNTLDKPQAFALTQRNSPVFTDGVNCERHGK